MGVGTDADAHRSPPGDTMTAIRSSIAVAVAAAALAAPAAAQAAPAVQTAAPAAVVAVQAAVPGVSTAPAAATAGTLKPGARGAAVVAVQQRLNQLGYWVGATDGVYGTATSQAVMALQKVAGLGRDGVLGPQTRAALDKGIRPLPRTRTGHVIEVDKARQVMIVADNGRATRVYNVSTGGEYRYRSGRGWATAHTPTGQWTVYRTVKGWETGPLGSMYRSHYVVGGIAIHGVKSPAGVGAYGASHGCIRMTMGSMDELIRSGAVRYGTTVRIY